MLALTQFLFHDCALSLFRFLCLSAVLHCIPRSLGDFRLCFPRPRIILLILFITLRLSLTVGIVLRESVLARRCGISPLRTLVCVLVSVEGNLEVNFRWRLESETLRH